jgi:hypothetical protein
MLIACGGSDNKKATPTVSGAQDAAKTQFCTQLNGFASAANQVNSLSSSSTVDDTKRAAANLKTSWEAVKTSAARVQNIKIDQLEAAQDNFQKQVATLPPNTTLGTAASTLAPSAQAMGQALTNVRTASACPQS